MLFRVAGGSQGRRRKSRPRSAKAVNPEEAPMSMRVYNGPVTPAPEMAWLTVTIRPAGTFGRDDTSRLRALLDALSPCASMIVLDLRATRLQGRSGGEVIEETAWDIERRGGCLVCINVDAETRACLSAAGHHAVLMDDASQLVALG
jgi:hypothetical protein